ncbi:MAG TPA: glycosyl hydrolase family 28-related protein, partial [Myxococcaceae bacterium]|nr:glycosyl hydrolase family 28-related protein [Myxococcaceae bacterium]
MKLREGWIVAVVLLSASGARAGLAVPPHLISVGLQNSPLAQAGYLDATAYGADPKGLKDSTSAIQAAINDAMKYAMTTYLPSGTYIVSRTLAGNATFSSSGCVAATSIGSTGRFPESPSLVGPASGPRPLIKLAPTATGFDSSARPAPLIFFQLVQSGSNWLQTADCFFYAVLRDIDLDLGGHAGAIGIQFAAAQYSYMENISVNAKGAYAGIYGVPSVETNVNLSVTGGQYGIIPETCCGISLVGVTLADQVVAGLKLNNFGATAVTGFDITESEGSAVINAGWAQTSQGVLIDGRITMTNGAAPAVANGNNDFYMRNVYVKTPGAIVHSGSNKPILAGPGTALVEEYSYTNPTPTTEFGITTTSYTLIGGVLGQAELATVKSNVSSVPSDLLTRNLPGPLPWFEDRGVVNVVGLGADPTGVADSTSAIQRALNSGTEVFVPRGDYKLSGTLQLKANSRFFGLPGYRSRFGASSSWNPNNTLVYMVRSASTSTSATHLG